MCVGSFAPVVLSVTAGRDELCVSECCCFVSLLECPSFLSQQTHSYQPGHLLLCPPTLSHQGGDGSFWSFSPVEIGS